MGTKVETQCPLIIYLPKVQKHMEICRTKHFAVIASSGGVFMLL